MKNGTNKILVVIGVLVLIAMVAVLAVTLNKNSSSDKKTISATGTYTMTVDPDKAEVYLSIQTEGKTATEVKDGNARKSTAVYDSLRGIGISTKDIETTQNYLQPQYDYTDGKSTLKGYIYINTIKVSTLDLDKVGVIIDKAVDAGATGVDNIQFVLTTDKEKDLKIQALAKATEDARLKGEAIAQGLKAELGDLVSVQESNFYYPPIYYARADMAVGGGEKVIPPVNPGKLEISSSVSAVFEIKQ